jgi:hypothetical protein
MRSLLSLTTLLLSAVHLIFFCKSWTTSSLDISSLLPGAPPKNLITALIAFATAIAIGVVGRLLKAKRLGIALLTAVTTIMAALFYLSTPLIKVTLPTAVIPLLIGLLIGAWALRYDTFTLNYPPPPTPRLSLLSYILIAFNILLLIAPSAFLAPTGFIAKIPWQPDNLLIRHDDSVAIANNLIFYSLRAAVTTLIGDSVMLNTIVSMILCAIGVGLFAFSAQKLAGRTLAILALLMIITERWVMVSAYAGNLPATLIACSGFLFFILTTILTENRDRNTGYPLRIALLVFAATIAALYSYAAVRMPFGISMIAIAAIQFLSERGGILRRVTRPILTIALPAALALGAILLVAYHGNVKHMRKELFVGWSPENIRPNPGPEGLKDFVLLHNPDLPVWKQIARPADGSNLSLSWTRTPSETLSALWKHLQAIAGNLPEFFPLQPLIFALAILAIIRAPLLPRPLQWGTTITLLWSCIWIASFLLVPDAVAYRRGVAFSAVLALLATFSLYGAGIKNRASSAVLALGLVIIVAKFPYELHFANQGEARARMFTLCNSSLAVRSLLKSAPLQQPNQNQTYLIAPKIEGERELSCKVAAVNSPEWRSLRPNSFTITPERDSVGVELKKLSAGATLITFCSPDTRQVADINTICEGTNPVVNSVAEVKIPNAIEPLFWRISTMPANPS